jgi:ankyrin repeat protein
MDNHSERPPPQDRTDRLIHALFLGAVQDGNYYTVLGLIGQGADPRDDFAVCEAAARGHLRILLLLSGAGADLRCHNDSPLCAAASNGHTDVVRELLLAGCDPSVHNHAPLRSAEKNGHLDTARVLRDAGSYNPDIPGDSPAQRAIASIRARFRPDP